MAEGNYSGVISGFFLGVSVMALYKFLNVGGYFSSLFRKTLPFSGGKDYKMVLVVRTDLNMGKGKIAAQCCHAALGCYKSAEKLAPEYVKHWLARGQPKIVLKLDGADNEEKLYELEEAARELNIPSSVVHDAGHTQVKSGTATCAAFGPAPASLINKITGNFKLL